MNSPHQVIILAGPNGAGKSTAAGQLLPSGITFVNADEIAKTLPNYPSNVADLEAARLAVSRLNELERGGSTFAVETTLASRSLAPRIDRLRGVGYRVRLLFLYLPGVELAIARVARRVKLGGHNIPDAVIRRRYQAGLSNFFALYQARVDRWSMFDTSSLDRPQLIAGGEREQTVTVRRPDLWERIRKEVGHVQD